MAGRGNRGEQIVVVVVASGLEGGEGVESANSNANSECECEFEFGRGEESVGRG